MCCMFVAEIFKIWVRFSVSDITNCHEDDRHREQDCAKGYGMTRKGAFYQ